ncbi:CCG-binding protein 1 [Capsicum chacoense]|uniref:CCG-binding protein 1 n=1 Tax=Capsicum annuum TaxID=4072 RepID=UPI0007BF0EB4|nr:CCG-binding protein 1 [Capsicum annuum]KAF3664334.1 putative pentatricopeptide repeat-containing protein-like isoform 1 [Capsicum annuum]KAF3667187.1 putative pentatricopeptide repeat-containing protein-like isoform 1 [Capsicum annuum]
MAQSMALNSLSSSFTGANNELPRIIPSSRFHVNSSTIRCCSRSNSYIPKLEPFSRTKLDRAVKDPPLIEKSENELADYCSVLEGDDSYSCWRAYFELKDLEKEEPKEEVERLILQAGGVKTLISCLHGISEMHKARKRSKGSAKAMMNLEAEGARHCPIPDGLPKKREELEEEEKARMPDSPYTKLLRARGTHPVWYSTTLDY